MDSTLTYADRAGFRCGTSFDYQAFDLLENEILNIRIKPLIAMERSVIDPKYMGLGNGKNAKEYFLKLKSQCERVGGDFSLLWHNSNLRGKNDFKLYKDIL